jgi:deoxyribonuclease V
VLEIPNIDACLISLVQQIPRGRVTTYGDLAAALGDRIAARWVGHFALNHPHYPSCRCHRIVRADGHLGLYVDGAAAKAERLQADGVSLRNGRVDLREFGCQMELDDPPLVALRQLQESVVDQVRLEPATGPWRLAAGVDVSYADPHLGVAAYALTDLATNKFVWSTTVTQRVQFPYIPSFLAFRELPLMLAALDKADRQHRRADVVLVDGSGVLHQRHAGIATHLGLLAKQTTVGVTKKRLFGHVATRTLAPGESSPIIADDGQVVGAALQRPRGSQRPIYVSPGYLIDVAQAEYVVRQTLAGHKLPEPLYWADRISREEAKK